MNPQQPYQPPAAPPQYSPDGRYYWDGTQWIPVAAPPPPPPMPYGQPGYGPPGYAQPGYPQPGYGQAPYGQPAAASGNGLSIAGIICGAIAFLLFPIILGPVGLVLGGIATSRHERLGHVALIVSGLGLVVGMLLGIAVATA